MTSTGFFLSVIALVASLAPSSSAQLSAGQVAALQKASGEETPEVPSWQPDEDQAGSVPRLVVQLGHPEDAVDAALSPDGKLLVTAGGKAPVLWEVATGRELRRFHGHDRGVRAVAFSPDGTSFWSGGLDRSVRRWDIHTGEELEKVVVHPDMNIGEGAESEGGSISRLLLSADGTRLFVECFETPSIVRDVPQQKELVRRMIFGSAQDAVFLPSGTLLVSQALSHEGRHAVLDLSLNKELFSLPQSGGWVSSLSPDGTELAIASNARIQCFRISDGEETWNHAFPEPLPYVQLRSEGQRLFAFSEDSALVLDWSTGRKLHEGALEAEFSPADVPSLGLNGRSVEQVDSLTGRTLRRFVGSNEAVKHLAFSADGRLLATAHGSQLRTADLREDFAAVWNTKLGGESHRIPVDGIEWTPAFAPDGEHLLVAGHLASELHALARDEDPRVFEELYSAFGMFTPDGGGVLTGGDENGVSLYDVETGKIVQRFPKDMHPWAASLRGMALSPDGSRLLVGGGYYYVGSEPRPPAHIVSTSTWKPELAFEEIPACTAVAYSPTGDRVATAGEEQVRLLDPDAGGPAVLMQGHSGEIRALAFSSKGKLLASASDDGTARIWDVASGQEVLVLKGHEGPVIAVCFHRDGRRVLTGSADMTTRVWDVETGAELARMLSFSDGSWAVVDTAGRFDASNGGEISGLHWVVGLQTFSLSQLKERYYEPGLLAKILGESDEPLRDVEALTSRGLPMPPEVQILQQPTSEDPTFRFRVKNSGGGVGRISVRVNQKQVVRDARSTLDPNLAEQEISLSMADYPAYVPELDNVIEVITHNAEEFLSSRLFGANIRPAKKAAEGATKLWAIVAGVSDYAGSSMRLAFASKDAEVMSDALLRAGTGLFGAENVDITVLSDSGVKATKANLVQAFADLTAKKVRSWDIVIVYLAGHGVSHEGASSASESYYFLAQNATSAKLLDSFVRANATLSSAELSDRLNQLPARKQVVILDTCQAGQLLQDLSLARDVPASQKRALDRLKDQTGMYLLAGSTADQSSYESSPYGHGLLTYSLLRTLKDGVVPAVDEEGLVHALELFHEAQKMVPILARDIGGTQEPQLSMPRGGSSFPLGLLDETKRQAIRLQSKLPVLLRPLFQRQDEFLDTASLSSKVNSALVEAMWGKNGRSFILDTGSASLGAYQLNGRYLQQGSTLTVTAKLYQFDAVQAETQLSGSPDSLPTQLATWALDRMEEREASKN